MSKVTHGERVLMGRMGAYIAHSRHDPRETTAAGRKAFWSSFERKVDPEGVLDPEDLIARVRRVASDREREVQLALGELVSYLEFELLNHPGIEDGASILEALEASRSRL